MEGVREMERPLGPWDAWVPRGSEVHDHKLGREILGFRGTEDCWAAQMYGNQGLGVPR
jgi:hypothetical protein